MRYVSTRGAAPVLAFDDVLLAGLAEDGGLYVPDHWPHFDAAEMASFARLSYPELAARVMAPFLGMRMAPDELSAIAEAAYRDFDHVATAPLVQMDRQTWMLELFHGPTLAFKDYALQLVGRLFDHVLSKRGQRVTIIGATSGDTGSAAIEACRKLKSVDIFILHPRGRVSEVQRRMMTTVLSPNVHNIAIDGTFDDCQDLVKAMFADRALREELALSAVNSINWARIAAQTVYYMAAGLALGAPHRPVAFAVPTGNFGNVYAGYAARAMGLPISQLIVASNRNDILARFFESGTLEVRGVEPSLSPSMDIQVSSNFERLMFDLFERDGAAVGRAMGRFRAEGRLAFEAGAWRRAQALFDGFRLDDDGTIETMRRIHGETGHVIDPHSAVGLAAARACARDRDAPVIALATAHPAKFPDAVERATGLRPALPPRHADLFSREERVISLPKDGEALKAFVRARIALTGAA
ncbi:MAG: threonine synthase [Alphaproteobacteria bacterium]